MANATPTTPAEDLAAALASFQQDYDITPEQQTELCLIIISLPTAPATSPRGHPVAQRLRNSIANICRRAAQLQPQTIEQQPVILPVDGNGMIKPYAFVAALTAGDALQVVAHMQGYILDRGHTLSARLVPDDVGSFLG